MKTKIIAMLIALVVLAGAATAAVIEHYATIQTSPMMVEQSIVIKEVPDNIAVHTIANPIAGNTYPSPDFTLQNKADITGYVKFVDLNPDVNVDTRIMSRVTLENKDADWNIISDDTYATLTYELNNDEFVFDFEAFGLVGETDYTLIYYADKPDRFVDWGGDNPGALIGSGMTNVAGDLVIDGITGGNVLDLFMDLPHSDDFNTGDYYDSEWNTADYGDSDGYSMRTGAKIWLVPTDDLNTFPTNPMPIWNPTAFLFETNLITYDDTIEGGENLRVSANSEFVFFTETTFDINIEGEYSTMVGIAPVV